MIGEQLPLEIVVLGLGFLRGLLALHYFGVQSFEFAVLVGSKLHLCGAVQAGPEIPISERKLKVRGEPHVAEFRVLDLIRFVKVVPSVPGFFQSLAGSFQVRDGLLGFRGFVLRELDGLGQVLGCIVLRSRKRGEANSSY